MKARRSLLSFLTLVLALVSTGSLSVWKAKRQYALDRQLIAALVHNDSKQAIALVNAGADPNTRYNPPPAPTLKLLFSQLLRRSPASADDSPTAFLLACGADGKLLESGVRGQMYRPDNLTLVQAMLKRGAIQHPHTAQDWIALDGAVVYDRVRISSLLLQYGADVNEQDKIGLTPLMGAAWGRKRDTVRLLLEHGADVRRTDRTGETALHFAMSSPIDTDVVRQLLAHGADPNQKDVNGYTPLMLAQDMHRPDLVALLRGNGRFYPHPASGHLLPAREKAKLYNGRLNEGLKSQ